MSSQLRGFRPSVPICENGWHGSSRSNITLPIHPLPHRQPFSAVPCTDASGTKAFRVFSSGYVKLQENSYRELSLQTVPYHFHDDDRGDRQVGRLFLEYCMVTFDGVACPWARDKGEVPCKPWLHHWELAAK